MPKKKLKLQKLPKGWLLHFRADFTCHIDEESARKLRKNTDLCWLEIPTDPEIAMADSGPPTAETWDWHWDSSDYVIEKEK